MTSDVSRRKECHPVGIVVVEGITPNLATRLVPNSVSGSWPQSVGETAIQANIRKTVNANIGCCQKAIRIGATTNRIKEINAPIGQQWINAIGPGLVVNQVGFPVTLQRSQFKFDGIACN